MISEPQLSKVIIMAALFSNQLQDESHNVHRAPIRNTILQSKSEHMTPRHIVVGKCSFPAEIPRQSSIHTSPTDMTGLEAIMHTLLSLTLRFYVVTLSPSSA